jgi:acetyl-CoA carboxylase biotin carboxyl carrier protein
MSDPNRPEPTGTAPAREPQREGSGGQQSQQNPDQQQRGGLQNRNDRRGLRRRHGGREGQSPQSSSQTSRTEASINMDELRELFSLIAAQGFSEFELEKEGFRVRLRRDLAPQANAGGGAPSTHFSMPQQQIHSTGFAPQQATHAQSAGEIAPASAQANDEKKKEAAPEAELFKITSPIVGTFYRSASPTAEPFVKVGSHVDPDTVVCIVEAMKLMNEILAETTGTVEKVYVENGQPVEFGQPLFGIRK